MRPANHAPARGVREEQLLAVDLVVGDRLLAFRRNQPVDEGLAELLLHVRMLGRVHQHDAVLVEQPLVAFDHDGEIALVLEREPGAAVGQHIGVRGRAVLSAAPMPWPISLVPGALVASAMSMPAAFQSVELGDMRAGVVAARDERRRLGLDGLERGDDVLAPLMPAGSLFGPIRTKSLYITG